MEESVKKFILMFLLGFALDSSADEVQVSAVEEKLDFDSMVLKYFKDDSWPNAEDEYKAKHAVKHLLCSIVLNYQKDNDESLDHFLNGMNALDDFAIKLANDGGKDYFSYRNTNVIVRSIPNLTIDPKIKDKNKIKEMIFQSLSQVVEDEASPPVEKHRMSTEANFEDFYKENCKPLIQ